MRAGQGGSTHELGAIQVLEFYRRLVLLPFRLKLALLGAPSLLAAMVVTSMSRNARNGRNKVEKLNSTNFKNLHYVVESTRINTIGISCGL